MTTTNTYRKIDTIEGARNKNRAPIQNPNILFISGLCGDGSEWEFLYNSFEGSNQTATVLPTTFGSDRKNMHEFAQNVRRFVDKQPNKSTFIISHSLGCIATLKAVMTIPEKVLGIVAICPSPQRGVWLPLKTVARNLRWNYIVRMITNKKVSLVDSDARYFSSGNDLTFSPDSPRLALGIGGTFGYWVPSLRMLNLNSVIINTSDDPVIGMKANKAIVRYHDTEVLTLANGGHYPHVHPTSKQEVERYIKKILLRWTR